MSIDTLLVVTGMLSFWFFLILGGVLVWFRKAVLTEFRRRKMKNKGWGYIFMIQNDKSMHRFFIKLKDNSFRINEKTYVIESEHVGSVDGFPALMYHIDNCYPLVFTKKGINTDASLHNPKILDNLIMETKTIPNIIGLVKNNKHLLYAVGGLAVGAFLIYQQLKDGDVQVNARLDNLYQLCKATIGNKPIYV